jgi:two-component system, cell cycle sensor histidine kinase and response regulator CckA
MGPAMSRLSDAERQVHKVLDSLFAFVGVLTPEGVLVEINRAALDAASLHPADVLGKPFEQTYWWTYSPEVQASLRDAIERCARGQVSRYDVRHQIGRDRFITVDFALVPMANDEDGRITHLIASGIDITDREQAEERLRQSEARLARAQEIAQLGSWELELRTRELVWSDEVFRIFGWPPGSEVTLERFEQSVHPEDRAAVDAAFLKALVRGEPYSFEHRIIRPDGTERHVRELARQQRDPEGQALRVVGTVQDITELKRLEDQFRQAQKLEAVGTLAGGVAHDFNNLLLVISGYGQMLFDSLSAGDPQREYVEEILKASTRAAALTHRLLAFSRRQVIQRSVLDLNHVITEVEKMLRRLIAEDIELIERLGPGLGKIKGDPAQIEQVLLNLVVNARDAMPSGGKIVIETSNAEIGEGENRGSMKPGAYVLLRLSDTGCGMSPETLRRVFEPFFTTKATGQGTGLGLSTVYGIVTQHGGEIFVKSEVGHGTRFDIYLPQMDSVAEEVPEGTGVAGFGLGRETVLLVEDDPAVRRMTREMLSSLGYAVIEARNPLEAIRLCGEGEARIDLVLTDVVMPQLSGPDLVERVKRIRPALKAIYMSGYPGKVVAEHGLEELGQEVLQKPFSQDVLGRKLREALDT